MEVYGRSKLANILFTAELAKRIEGTGVTANSLHPGSVATGYARDGDTTGLMALGVKVYNLLPISLTPEKGARTSVYLCSSPEVDGVTGRYFAKSKEKSPSANARDEAAATRLWEVSEELVGGGVGG
jgi:NAD(P)-dependent dehydrogenase (short-subunit alcohol dehydrogenase family)